MDIIPAIIFFALLVALAFFTFAYLAPLLGSAREVEPAWQLISVGNIVNFREAAYFYPVKIEVASNCTKSMYFTLWYILPHAPGELEISNDSKFTAVFEGGRAEPIGAAVESTRLYEAMYLTAVFTNISNVPAGAVYGEPIKIYTTEVKRIVITPSSGSRCLLEVKLGNKNIYSGVGVFLEIYNATAVWK